MTIKQLRKVRTELHRQVATNRLALGRLEYLGSEEVGRCYITEQVRRAVKRGEKLLDEIGTAKRRGSTQHTATASELS